MSSKIERNAEIFRVFYLRMRVGRAFGHWKQLEYNGMEQNANLLRENLWRPGYNKLCSINTSRSISYRPNIKKYINFQLVNMWICGSVIWNWHIPCPHAKWNWEGSRHFLDIYIFFSMRKGVAHWKQLEWNGKEGKPVEGDYDNPVFWYDIGSLLHLKLPVITNHAQFCTSRSISYHQNMKRWLDLNTWICGYEIDISHIHMSSEIDRDEEIFRFLFLFLFFFKSGKKEP